MIDKDIEIIKENIADGTIYVRCGFTLNQAIENVLKELEKEKTKNLELNIELKTFKQSNKNLLAKKSELETYKKIAEKLAEELTKLTEENKEYYLDWARKEVEKEC